MKKSRMISAFFVAVVTFITMSANAAPVLYDEAVGGDIKFDFFSLSIRALTKYPAARPSTAPSSPSTPSSPPTLISLTLKWLLALR